MTAVVVDSLLTIELSSHSRWRGSQAAHRKGAGIARTFPEITAALPTAMCNRYVVPDLLAGGPDAVALLDPLLQGVIQRGLSAVAAAVGDVHDGLP